MKFFPRITISVAALMLSACAGMPDRSCRDGQHAVVSDLLYFGTAMQDGLVSAGDWRDFVDGVVTPRFPDGLTVWSASGQWKSQTGGIVREPSYVLNLVHADDPATEAKVREIVSEYRTRFHQESVLRLRAAACASF